MIESKILNRFVEERRVDGSLLLLLQELAGPHQEALEFLIEELHPSANTFREFIELMREISARDQFPLSMILSKPLLERSLGGALISAKEKQRRLRAELERRRFPERFRIQERLDVLSIEIRRNFGVVIEFPPELEGDAITLSMKVRSPEQLASQAEKLMSLSTDSRLKEIYSILLGEFSEGMKSETAGG